MGRAKPHDELLWGITWLLWRPIRIRGGLRRCAGYSARPDAPRRFVSKRPEHLWLDAVSAFDVLVGPDGAEGVKAVNLFVDGQRRTQSCLRAMCRLKTPTRRRGSRSRAPSLSLYPS